MKTPTRSRVPFRTLTTEWEATVLPMYKPSTQKNHRHIIAKHLLPRFGDTPVCDVTRQEIQAYVAHLNQAGYAPKTVDRIINAFPAEEQNQVRVMLAGCLAGVVAQLLCKRLPKGRCAVHEILLQHEALPNTIRSGQISNIRAIIEGGGADGMCTMDQSLLARVKDGTIAAKEAYLKAANKALFTPLLQPGELEGGH